MRRSSWYALLLAAAVVAFAALPAESYQLFSQPVGVSGVSPERWQSLPVNVTVDNGPTDILAEVTGALTTWNNVTTAQNPFGTPTLAQGDFNAANLGTAWGDLSGDGRQEVVVDETGDAIRALGFAPEGVNGFGPRHETVTNGKAVIDDMFLILNGQRHDFDRLATEVHELGHTIGLAHSTVGFSLFKDGALSPPLVSQVPTMHPFNEGGTDRETLEADDRAALSELYPEATFATSTGTLAGSVLRCDTGGAVNGANVRVINVADESVQLTRVTGFDGTTGGTYEIKGIPPGSYKVVVEPLSGDAEFAGRLAMFTDVDTDFTQERFNDTEDDCAQDTDLTASTDVPVSAGATAIANFKVTKATLALVIDVTGSMGPEIGAVKTGLETMISALDLTPGDFPETAIVTFDDNAKVNTVSHDPARLRSVIAGLTTHSTPDCPEGSNAALMTAGRLLGSGGRAILITDAESLPSGPSRATVDALYEEKGARISTLLSGSCDPNPAPLRATRALAAPGGGGAPDEARPLDQLGNEPSIRTFSEESLFSGGLFSFQPDVNTVGATDAQTRYANTLANVGISAVRPAVAGIEPAVAPRGTTFDVELTGSNTGFRAGSALAVEDGGVAISDVRVLSPTRLVARLTAAVDAQLSFRDVTVTTPRGDGSTETARGIGAVQVTAAPSSPTILSVTPSAGTTGTTESVRISGGATHFAAANSSASFGQGVTVNALTVESPTSATANVTISAGATIRFNDVTVQTGAETARGARRFLIAAPAPPVPRLTGASPSSAARGATVEVRLTGAGTAFAAGTSTASVSGTGVQVLSTTVESQTSVRARVRIASDAPLGFRDMKVTTGAVSAVLLDGFEITPVPQPPAATPTAAPVPVPAPACVDRTAPTASFSSLKAKKQRLLIRGRATDAGCAGAVVRVELAIARKAGSKCRFVAANGKLTARSPVLPAGLPQGGRNDGLEPKPEAPARRLHRPAARARSRRQRAARGLQARQRSLRPRARNSSRIAATPSRPSPVIVQITSSPAVRTR